MASSKKATAGAPVVAIPLPEQPSIDTFLAADDSFQGAYLRALAAVATKDGFVSFAEFALLSEVAQCSEQAALATLTFLASIESPIDLGVALAHLSKASLVVDADDRRTAWDAAKPLLMLQGENARDVAKRLAKALRADVPTAELSQFPTGSGTTLWQTVARKSSRMMKGGQVVEVAQECVRVTGDPALVSLIGSYLDGELAPALLQARIMTVCAEIATQLVAFEAQVRDSESLEGVTEQFAATADQLHRQVKQRLALVNERIRNEIDSLDYDIDDAVHDAGNAIEVEIQGRFVTDDWKNPKAWEHIGRTAFAKELERRIDRVVGRHETQLRLMKEDLRLFREELRLVGTTVFKRQHHSNFSQVMPALRLATRVVNSLDSAANATLVASAAGAVGAVTAGHFLGAAAVLPVIVPVAPYVGAAVLVAGLFKWLSADSESRRSDEVLHKRKAFEKAMHEQLGKARESYVAQLRTLAEEYALAADALMTPALLEAAAAEKLKRRRDRIVRQVLSDVRSSLARLNASVAALS